MSCKSTNVKQAGSSSPIQSAIDPADYSSVALGDNTVSNLSCDASVAIGDVVYVNGSTLEKASALSYLTSLVVGIVISKSGATTCDIVTSGPTNALSGLDTSKKYFLSETTAGALQTTPPTLSGSYVVQLGKPIATTIFTIQIQRIVKRV